MNVQPENSTSGHLAGIRLSPLAVLILGLGAPIASATFGGLIRDRLSTGTETAQVVTKVDQVQRNVDTIADALKAHLNDSVHRGEFAQLQTDDHEKVSREEFLTQTKSFEGRLDQIRDDLKDIKDSLRIRGR